MTTISPDSERRINPDLREFFIEAYDIIRPFFDQANMWAGQPHEHLAFMALHERFPHMSGEQVFIIVSAARRVFDTGDRPAP